MAPTGLSYTETVEAIVTFGTDVEPVYTNKVPLMRRLLNRIGYQVSDLNRLNIIHVTGTKGKGSTCAFAESILRHRGFKTACLISPHVVNMRERILFDGKSVSEEVYCRHFWDVYNKLLKTKENDADMPEQRLFLTLMAFDIFLCHDIDVMILEVGVGGEYDYTNLVASPVACGVTHIHLDHMDKLGNTVESIAWHKSGIFKPGAHAVTVPQKEEVTSVLESRALERQATFSFAPPLDRYDSVQPIKLGLAGDFHKYNASLALQLCRIWLQKTGQNMQVELMAPLEEQELKVTSRIGRTQIVHRPGATIFLDTSHTNVSLQAYADWFLEETKEEKQSISGSIGRVLIFHFAKGRDIVQPLNMLKELDFDLVLFCPCSSVDEVCTEQFFPVSYETQFERSENSKKIWDDICSKSNNQSQSRLSVDKNHQMEPSENSSINNTNHPESYLLPSLRFAMDLLRIDIREKEVQNQHPIERVIPEKPENIRNTDHIQVMVAGGHKVVGSCLWLLEED